MLCDGGVASGGKFNLLRLKTGQIGMVMICLGGCGVHQWKRRERWIDSLGKKKEKQPRRHRAEHAKSTKKPPWILTCNLPSMT